MLLLHAAPAHEHLFVDPAIVCTLVSLSLALSLSLSHLTLSVAPAIVCTLVTYSLVTEWLSTPLLLYSSTPLLYSGALY
jgi:flagellar biosynthesis protein FliQ